MCELDPQAEELTTVQKDLFRGAEDAIEFLNLFSQPKSELCVLLDLSMSCGVYPLSIVFKNLDKPTSSNTTFRDSISASSGTTALGNQFHFFPINFHLLQHHLLKNSTILPCGSVVPLAEINEASTCMSLFLHSLFFH